MMGLSSSLILLSLWIRPSYCRWERYSPTASDPWLQGLRNVDVRAEDRHPLDPLTPDEIRSTRDIIDSEKGKDFRFILIQLKEPLKADLLPYFLQDLTPPQGTIPRKAFVRLDHKMDKKVFEAVVNLETKTIESFVMRKKIRPRMTDEEQMAVEKVLSSNVEIRERCAKAGWANLSLVTLDFVGVWDKYEYGGKRVAQVHFFGSNFKNDNLYAHPFDFVVIVDLETPLVLHFIELPTHDDFDGSNKKGNVVPKKDGNYDYRLRGGEDFLRKDDKPITISSPEGPSFTVKGYQVQWQKWKMRVGFNGREGLVLHTVSYNDSGKLRPVLYRASIVELFVPYGDPRPPYHRHVYYDVGGAGIGWASEPLFLNKDVVGEAHLFDAVLHSSSGRPIYLKNVISVSEGDDGILWKHVDYRTGKGNVVVRSHKLMFTFVATLANYDYIFNWSFYQDGSIMVQAQMTGIALVILLALGSKPAGHGAVVAPQLYAHYHQHLFTVRLDMDVDGPGNSVHMLESVALPEGSGNPYGQGFTSKMTPLRTPAEARTHVSPESGRCWVVTNPSNNHTYTQTPVGWKLIPLNPMRILMKKDSPIRQQAGWLDYDTWVTRYSEGQLYPPGHYTWVNDTGLPEWVEEDRDNSLEDTDIVLWHTFGLTHVPRVEDFPVMPVESTGFWLKPRNFFLENPGIDVPTFKR